MPTETRCLSVSEVCSIIEVCGKAKVTSLKLGDLQVEFGSQAPSPPPLMHESSPWAPFIPQARALASASPSTPATEIADTLAKEAERALAQDELNVRKDQLAQIGIENPVAYEEMINNGELDEDDALGEEDET